MSIETCRVAFLPPSARDTPLSPGYLNSWFAAPARLCVPPNHPGFFAPQKRTQCTIKALCYRFVFPPPIGRPHP